MAAMFELPNLPPASLSALERTVQEIEAVTPTPRSVRREKAARQVSEVDGLLEELEQLHLRGYVRVPDPVVARVSAFLDTLPDDCARVFPVRTRITRVIDELFEVQDSLLSIKVAGRSTIIAQDSAER
jgi:hypothetical protein